MAEVEGEHLIEMMAKSMLTFMAARSVLCWYWSAFLWLLLLLVDLLDGCRRIVVVNVVLVVVGAACVAGSIDAARIRPTS